MVEENDPQAGVSEIAKRLKRGGKKAIIIQQAQAKNIANKGEANEELGSNSDNDNVGD